MARNLITSDKTIKAIKRRHDDKLFVRGIVRKVETIAKLKEDGIDSIPVSLFTQVTSQIWLHSLMELAQFVLGDIAKPRILGPVFDDSDICFFATPAAPSELLHCRVTLFCPVLVEKCTLC